jgi:hypothetical protein
VGAHLAASAKAHYAGGMADTGDESVLWTAVDAYLADHLITKDDVLEAALRDSEAAELPPIEVTALQGKMLQMFARMVGARRILEVGTLGGYSTIWLARALPEGGRLVTLEAAAKHATVARKNLERAGLIGADGAPVELREGPALDTLPRLVAQCRVSAVGDTVVARGHGDCDGQCGARGIGPRCGQRRCGGKGDATLF